MLILFEIRMNWNTEAVKFPPLFHADISWTEGRSKTDCSKCRQGCEQMGAIVHLWPKWKLVQLLCYVWQCLRSLNLRAVIRLSNFISRFLLKRNEIAHARMHDSSHVCVQCHETIGTVQLGWLGAHCVDQAWLTHDFSFSSFWVLEWQPLCLTPF